MIYIIYIAYIIAYIKKRPKCLIKGKTFFALATMNKVLKLIEAQIVSDLIIS